MYFSVMFFLLSGTKSTRWPYRSIKFIEDSVLSRRECHLFRKQEPSLCFSLSQPLSFPGVSLFS